MNVAYYNAQDVSELLGISKTSAYRLIKHYYDYIDNRLKVTTVENKKHLIDKKILPFFGQMKINTQSTLCNL